MNVSRKLLKPRIRSLDAHSRKANNVFHRYCALLMLRELTNSQLAATDAPTEKVRNLFSLSFDYIPMKRNPQTLQSEPYEIKQRLRTTYIQFVALVHRLTYCLLLILRDQPQQDVESFFMMKLPKPQIVLRST